jgi:hypothetical protein
MGLDFVANSSGDWPDDVIALTGLATLRVAVDVATDDEASEVN